MKKGSHHSEESRKKLSLSLKGRHCSPKTEFKKGTYEEIFGEVKIQNFLRFLGIEFFTHQYMHINHGYQCDILIPSMNLVIECDGDWYHGNKNVHPNLKDWQIERIKRDQLRTSELIEKGFRVLRLWEHEINDMDIEIFKDRMELR
jgi:very-short-patch-repair endonuclease